MRKILPCTTTETSSKPIANRKMVCVLTCLTFIISSTADHAFSITIGDPNFESQTEEDVTQERPDRYFGESSISIEEFNKMKKEQQYEANQVVAQGHIPKSSGFLGKIFHLVPQVSEEEKRNGNRPIVERYIVFCDNGIYIHTAYNYNHRDMSFDEGHWAQSGENRVCLKSTDNDQAYCASVVTNNDTGELAFLSHSLSKSIVTWGGRGQKRTSETASVKEHIDIIKNTIPITDSCEALREETAQNIAEFEEETEQINKGKALLIDGFSTGVRGMMARDRCMADAQLEGSSPDEAAMQCD